MGLSTTALDVRGGVSGGTLNTIVTVVEEVPDEKRRESRIDFALSPGVFIVIPHWGCMCADFS